MKRGKTDFLRCRKGAALLMAAALAILSSAAWASRAEGLAPAEVRASGGRLVGRYAERTLVVALSVDREGASVLAYTVKERPFEAPLEPPPPIPSWEGRTVQVEVVLKGDDGVSFTRRLEVPGLCLDHPPGTDPHIAGDTIRLHRESFTVELPERAGLDRLEAAIYREEPWGLARIALGSSRLGPETFTPAGGPGCYSDLAFASSPADGPPTAELTPGTVHWPQEYGDPDIVSVYGNAAETSSRINIVIVPDGYTYAEKATMQAHAQAIATTFRAKTPLKEHDPFFNYILVYAYSTESGTDQCDCSIVKDTAMATRFPKIVDTCGASDNRCLYYGNGNGGPDCDPNISSANIVAAELRAPAKDATVIMVNTARYGGCGGARAVYSAGVSGAADIAIHEVGHSLAGLADEYAYDAGCGYSASEVNTSLNATQGAWPEWISTIGAPKEGAEYYQECVYRPQSNCEMRSLNTAFCQVCIQHWSLGIFGHSRVNPTAPIASKAPASPVNSQTGASVTFSVQTRLAAGATNSVTWKIQGPGFPSPTVVATGVFTYTHAFAAVGTFTLTCEVVADTNFIKPEKTGANRDIASWTVNVAQGCTLACYASGGAIPNPTSLTASFTATATPANCVAAVTFLWDFGDGFTSTLPNPTHTYAQGGTYTWVLTAASGPISCTKTGFVTVGVIPCALSCSASAAPGTGIFPLSVAFSAMATGQNCTGNPTFSWSFGDGYSSAEQNPTHVYQAPGSYSWWLTARQSGEICTRSGVVSVTAPCALACEVAAVLPEGTAPATVSFEARADAPYCSGVPSFAWDFGDGTTSSEQDPAHTYPTAGTYSWKMTVTQAGLSCTRLGTVRIRSAGVGKPDNPGRGGAE